MRFLNSARSLLPTVRFVADGLAFGKLPTPLNSENFDVVCLASMTQESILKHFQNSAFSNRLPDYRHLESMLRYNSGCLPEQGYAYYAFGAVCKVPKLKIEEYRYFVPRVTRDEGGVLFASWVDMSLPWTERDNAIVSKESHLIFHV